MRPRTIIVVCIVLVITCIGFWYGCKSDGWIENRAPMGVAPKDQGIPEGLLNENIETTDYSAIVFVEKGMFHDSSRLKRKLGGYVNHIYRARVLETIRGPQHAYVTYSVMAEADIDPILPNYPVLVSLCGSEKTGFYVPDNGYEIPATDSVKARARIFVKQPKKSALKKSVCSTD
jgi:hypothetical protein